MLRNPRFSLWWLVLFLGVVFVFGCGSKDIPPLPPEEVHIMKVAGLYGAYRQAHNGKPPANTKEFTDWAKTLKADQLARYGITDLNEALVSPRDGEPYQIAPVGNARMGMSPVVIYEKVGVDGKHMKASSMGSSGEISHEDLTKIVPNL